MNNITRETLQPYLDRGFKIIAVDEGKKPRMSAGFYEAPNTEDYINMMMTDQTITGFGIAGGNGVVFIDFDDMTFYEKALELEPELKEFPSELTGKGVHVGLKVDSDEPIGCFKVASIMDSLTGKKKDVIEVKGHHGFVVMAPSEHWASDGKPSGKHYRTWIGNMADLPVIARAEWDRMVASLSSLNEVVEAKKVVAVGLTTFRQADIEKQFNAKFNVPTILLRNGYCQDPGSANKFKHPNSTSGQHGLTVAANDCAFSFNANDPLCDKNTHNAFDCLRILECGGDWGDAYRKAEKELGIEPMVVGSGRKILREYEGDLLTMNIPALKFAIDNFMPQGMTILAGSPKIGKSWMALQMCIAVATGGKVLGETCEKGEAVYLSLEDGRRRLKERLQKCLPGATATPTGLFVMGADSMEPLMEGGLEQLQNWVEDHPDTRLIVIDTMEHIKGQGNKASKNKNAYEADVAFWKPLQIFSQKANISILLITHLKKEQAGGDQFNRVTGSIGITGTADTNILLSRERGSKDAKLLLTSREIEEREELLIFNTATFSWELAVMPAPGLINMNRIPTSLSDLILAVLKTHGELSPKSIHRFLVDEFDTKKSRKDVGVYLIRLVEKGDVERKGRGLYALKATN